MSRQPETERGLRPTNYVIARQTLIVFLDSIRIQIVRSCLRTNL